MTGINGISAYQQINQSVYNEKSGVSKTPDTGRADQAGSAKNSQQAKVETKAWSPIDTTSSLVPRKTEYGMTIGDVQLSDKAKDYYNSLKSKYHNMEFIAVSKDMKAQVQQNAASYGNANKMVVLIDEEKLLSVSSDGRNAAAKGIIGKICSAIDEMMRVSNALPVDQSMNMYGMTAYGDYSDWSLCLYRDMLTQEYNGERHDEFAEDWDELEKSIIANIADDVKVWIRGEKIEITVFKRFK